MVLQIWLWESSTVPDFYLRELKYSHCLSSFFLRWGDECELGMGWCGVWKHAVFCCIVILLMPEINFGINNIPIHHHPSSAKSIPSYSDWGRCLAVCYPYFRHHYFMVPYCMYSISSGSPPSAWWESSTAWRVGLIANRIYLWRQQNKKGLDNPWESSTAWWVGLIADEIGIVAAAEKI